MSRENLEKSHLISFFLRNLSEVRERSPNYYVNNIVDWLNPEWRKSKRLIFRNINNLAVEFDEEIEFDVTRKLKVIETLRLVVGLTRKELLGKISEQEKLAKTDAGTRLGGAFDTSTVLTSTGLQQALGDLTAQTEFFDDVTENLETRIDRLLDATYGTVGDLSLQLDHVLRISREEIIASFESGVGGLADSLRSGRITSQRFKQGMLDKISANYKRAYRAGKGTPLDEFDLDFIKRQVASQEAYLDNFVIGIDATLGAGEKLGANVVRRVKLYSGRATAMYEAGWIQNLTNETLIDWVLGIAEHCETCPIYSGNSPYIKSTLPGLPGEGFNITQCGVNCKCHLEINFLSAEVV